MTTPRGKRGLAFEKEIDNACLFYLEKRLADIIKYHTKVVPVRDKQTGMPKSFFYSAKAGCDYRGILENGRGIVFEAKHVAGRSLSINPKIFKPTQIQEIIRAGIWGHEAFVLTRWSDGAIIRLDWDGLLGSLGEMWDDPFVIPHYRFVEYCEKQLADGGKRKSIPFALFKKYGREISYYNGILNFLCCWPDDED